MDNLIIGGMFGLPELTKVNNQVPPFLSGNRLLLANARSGIKVLIDRLEPNTIWMPSYLCDVMVKAARGFNVKFYEVDGNLHVMRGWLENVKQGDLTILIDYFGFALESDLVNELHRRGAWVLEDASQALLSSGVGDSADFVLFSPRKFLGIPDGGILRSNSDLDLTDVRLEHPQADWWTKALSSTIQRRDFDLFGKEGTWFELFRETDRTGPIGAFIMSDLSGYLLEKSFDYREIIQKRRENYGILDHYLNQYSLFPGLEAGVVPLGYAVRLPNRDQVRERLFQNKIYPPIHWPIADFVPADFIESHVLAGCLLTLVCDQRYGPEDMERTAKIVLEEVRD